VFTLLQVCYGYFAYEHSKSEKSNSQQKNAQPKNTEADEEKMEVEEEGKSDNFSASLSLVHRHKIETFIDENESDNLYDLLPEIPKTSTIQIWQYHKGQI